MAGASRDARLSQWRIAELKSSSFCFCAMRRELRRREAVGEDGGGEGGERAEEKQAGRAAKNGGGGGKGREGRGKKGSKRGAEWSGAAHTWMELARGEAATDVGRSSADVLA